MSLALEDNVGPAVASQSAAREPDQSTPAGRAANRAAVVHLDLVATQKPEPRPEIPNQTQPTCALPSDDWSFSTIFMGSGGRGFGGAVLTMVFINKRTACFHHAVFIGAGFAGGGKGASMSFPSSSDLPPLPEESFSFQLSGAGALFSPRSANLGSAEWSGGCLCPAARSPASPSTSGGSRHRPGRRPGRNARVPVRQYGRDAALLDVKCQEVVDPSHQWTRLVVADARRSRSRRQSRL